MENTKHTVTEEQIKTLAIETDKFMAQQVVMHKDVMHPLEVSAILLSRIMMLCKSIGLEDHFKKLANAAINMQEPEPLIKAEDATESSN